MPKRKKPATELTRDELALRVFPKRVVNALKKIAAKSKKRRPRSHKSSLPARLDMCQVYNLGRKVFAPTLARTRAQV